MKSVIKKKSYFIITHPDYHGVWVENFGDRTFYFKNGNCTTISNGITIDGDEHWEITQDNILTAADYILEQEYNVKKTQLEAIRLKAEKEAAFKKRLKEIITLRWF